MYKKDDPKQLILFDVQTDKGIIGPEQFIRDFNELNIARVFYRGKLTGKFIDDVREGKYGVVEGVVCKGGKGGEDLWMMKIKTNAYMTRLQQVFKDNWNNYWGCRLAFLRSLLLVPKTSAETRILSSHYKTL